MYAYLKGDEDGNPLSIIEEDIATFLMNADDYGIAEFKDEKFLKEYPDPNYWAEGVAVLLKLEVKVPRSVTKSWGL